MSSIFAWNSSVTAIYPHADHEQKARAIAALPDSGIENGLAKGKEKK